jgi:hypothetical protein
VLVALGVSLPGREWCSVMHARRDMSQVAMASLSVLAAHLDSMLRAMGTVSAPPARRDTQVAPLREDVVSVQLENTLLPSVAHSA